MNITTPKQIRRSIAISNQDDEYPYYLQFYNYPPTEDISLQEFEELAVERLKVLRIVESVGLQYTGKKFLERYHNELVMKLRSQSLGEYCKKAQNDDIDSNIRRRDHLSHFILRLAFCRNDQYRSWFIDQEVDLFRARFLMQSLTDRLAFVAKNNLSYKQMPETERKHVIKIVMDLNQYITNEKIAIFKVPFTEVDYLLRKRKVYLHDGYAYITATEIEPLITNIYRSRLSLGMAKIRRSLPALEEDKRCFSILDSLPLLYTGKDYSSSHSIPTGTITADMVDSVSKHFPPCMMHLHDSFKQNHHLRHGGRQQFSLFLKGIGLTLDEAISYWRREFCKRFSEDEFSKKYLYNIRHNFGQEGRRHNYTPYTCVKVILGSVPGPGDAHGCPFRHWDRQELRKFFMEHRIPSSTIQQMYNLTDEKHYDVACTAFFEAVHGKAPENRISHPNQYFEESRKLAEKKN